MIVTFHYVSLLSFLRWILSIDLLKETFDATMLQKTLECCMLNVWLVDNFASYCFLVKVSGRKGIGYASNWDTKKYKVSKFSLCPTVRHGGLIDEKLENNSSSSLSSLQEIADFGLP